MSSDIHAVTVPKWGLSMEAGQVVCWHVSPGTHVEIGDELLDIETSKIANAVESEVTGTLRRIVAGPGETVGVGQLLAVITGEAVSDDGVDSFISEFQASYVPPEVSDVEEAQPQLVEIDGARISYKVTGRAEIDRVPILLIHGFGGDCDSWLFNIAALSDGRRVIAPDLPGHGASSKRIAGGSLTWLAAQVSVSP